MFTPPSSSPPNLSSISWVCDQLFSTKHTPKVFGIMKPFSQG